MNNKDKIKSNKIRTICLLLYFVLIFFIMAVNIHPVFAEEGSQTTQTEQSNEGSQPEQTTQPTEIPQTSAEPSATNAADGNSISALMGSEVYGVATCPINITIRKGETVTITAIVIPDNATDKNILWSSSNENVVTVSGGVATAVDQGNAIITVTTEDGGFKGTCNVTVTPYVKYDAFKDLGFVPKDTAMDPDRNVMYMTESGGYKLYRIDLDTGEKSEIYFPYKAERLALKNGKLYVTMTYGHSPNYGTGNGYILVVDTPTFSVDKIINVVPDPYDIEADGLGRLYISPGSGGWAVLSVYNLATEERIYTYEDFKDQVLFDYNSVYSKLYTITTDITAYEINDGSITKRYTSPCWGDYDLSAYMKISPDGKYIFNGSGNIFACAQGQTGDMAYVRNIGHTFSSVCFDTSNDEFYIACNDRMYIYDYDTWTLKRVQGNGDIYKGVYCCSNHFASLMQTRSGGKYYIYGNNKEGVDVKGVSVCGSISLRTGETTKLATDVSPYDATDKNVTWSSNNESVVIVSNGVVTAVGLGNAVITVTTDDGGFKATCNITVTPYVKYDAYNDLRFVPMDTAMDQDRDAVYMTETGGYKLQRIDLSTGEKSEIYFPYKAERLTVKNGKIYVTLPHGKHDPFDFSGGSGFIAVVDASTFTLDKMFYVQPDPYDVEADSAGRVYIASGSGQWSFISVYNSETGEQICTNYNFYNRGLLDYNAEHNKLYAINETSTTSYITAYEITNGSITKCYESAYDSSHAMSNYMKISPDGKYIFNGSGNIFASAPTWTGDMVYVGNIDLTFDSICFDLNKNEFYIENDHGMYICDYNTFKVKAAQGANDLYKGVYCNSSHFVTLMSTSGGKYYLVLDDKTPGLSSTGVTLSPENITILKGETETLTANTIPKYATDQNMTWTSSNEGAVTVSNGVITGVGGGTAVITVTTEDGGFTDTCNINVIAYEEYNPFSGLWFTPLDTAIDPDRNYIYMTETEGNKLYRIDLGSGKIDYIKFPYNAERFTLKNGKIYVTLPNTVHSIQGNGSGFIGVVDASTFSIDKIIYVVPDPYDIEADDSGRVYIGSGSGQNSILTVYDTESGQQIDSIDSYWYQNLMDFNPVYNKLYFVPTQQSPIYPIAYEISDGMIAARYSWPASDHSISSYIKVSPDGKYLFSGSGNVFTCAPQQTGDMVYAGKTDAPYNSICFDVSKDQFFIANDTRMYICDYNTFKVIATFDSKDYYKGVYRNNNIFVSLMMTDGGKYYLALDYTAPHFDVKGVHLSESDVSIIKGDTETITATISPKYATNQNITWKSSNEEVATVSDGVITAVNLGSAVITVTTEDGGVSASCSVSVIPNNAYNELGFVPLDLVKDTNRHVAYMTEEGSNKLYRVDLDTGHIEKIRFQYNAERLTIKNDKIYVTLPTTAHGGLGDGSGYVGVVDAASFTVDKIFHVVPDPYDIEADDEGRVYIGSGSGGSSSILTVYDTATGRKIDSADFYMADSLFEFNAEKNILYSITTNASPKYMTAYVTSDGKITNRYVCPSSGKAGMSSYMKISPDGQLIFNGSGNVFLSDTDQEYDMLYLGSIGSVFNAICFDLLSDQFYIANGKTLTVYSYSQATVLKTLKNKYEITSLIRDGGKLIGLQEISVGKYNLAVMLRRPTTVTAESANYNGIKVTWDKVDGASGYQLYRSTSKYGTYSLIKTTTALNYTDTSLNTGKTYYYKINAYTGPTSAAGDFSNIVSATPSLTDITGAAADANSPTSIKLSWNPVTGRSGYEIERRAGSTGGFVKIKSTNLTNYNDTNLTPGITYSYRVRAYRTVNGKPVYGGYSSIVYDTPIVRKVTGINAVPYTVTKNKISWIAITGCSGYEILRSLTYDGSYTKIDSTTKTCYYNSEIEPNKMYYYKVKAYSTISGVRYYGLESDIVSAATYFGSVTSAAANVISPTSVKVTWGAVSGSSGYEIQRSESQDIGYSPITTTTKVYYTDKTVIPGKTYYYRVRAYVNVDGNKFYTNPAQTEAAKPVLSVVTGTVASRISSSKIKLTWNPVLGCSGYEIFRCDTIDGSYINIKNVTTSGWYDTEVTTGKTYYYEIRAYKTINNVKYYGLESAIICATP